MSEELNNSRFLRITKNFKYWLILILIIAIGVRLYFIFLFSTEEVVTEKLILFLALFIMTFVWFLENRDRTELSTLNSKLIKYQQRLVKTNFDTIRTLVSTIEAKDPYTRGHCERVTAYAMKIADTMNLNRKFKETLRNAAYIHDIGKLDVSDEILNKPGKLTEEEWDIVKRHPKDGVEILYPLDFLNKEKRIILHHHEYYNGNGYPDGIKGEDIPLGARILCVADSFDAMNSIRAYRAALTKDEIVKELENCKGAQFDPDIVDALLEIIKKDSKFLFKPDIQKSNI